ncbi:GAF and ANTAR domain-containing protein [Hoyosella sp. YIM 151337]|uniref:GAF and ANTAR domain-containing protein n=1 Tax=Hoyosella sp. YIM 151337 TaxID=2992742 RepID=UPI0022360752|nr:GAF and ANTAR domain-containing protein [Hoyosella sp. YIM 151337]MCW4353696.1 GAF and ANTAR domain-containing protein [Hoyosella sp. YIM 151337]
MYSSLTQALLKQADTAADVAEHVIANAKLLIDGADFVSVTLRDSEGKYYTPVATSDVCAELDHVQYSTGEGPCVECARENGPGYIHSSEIGADARWPRFGPPAARLGIAALLSVTLEPGPRSVHPPGALNVYSTRRAGISEEDMTTALVLSSYASLALAHTDAVTYRQLREHHLKQAIESRDVIGQAKGILMSRQGCSADAAFNVLKETSQHMNVKLIEIAQTIVNRHGELGQD